LVSLLTGWVKTNKIVLSNSSSLIGTTAISSVIGFFYWLLAARRFSPEAVGIASASISAMMLLSTAGVLGFGTLLIGELPQQPGREKTLITTALITVGITGAVLGILFALGAPWLSPGLRALSESFANISLFSFGVCLTAIALVLDQAMIGLLRGGLQFWRNIIMAVAKLGILLIASFYLSTRSGLIIYGAWVAGILISLVVIGSWVILRNRRIREYFPQWGLLRQLGRPAISHHALNLSLQVTGLILPLLVTTILSVSMNAYFYTAWMIANLAFVGPAALTTVLYAVVAADKDELIQKIRLTLKLSLWVGLLTSGVLIVGSSLLLNFFGTAYAQEAAWCLRILGLGVFPLIIRTHYVAIYRIFDRIVSAAKIMALCSINELVFAAIGAWKGGLAGLSLGWLMAMCIEAVLMSKTVFLTASSGYFKGSHKQI
jgi:O-antigen/teichoic acid export membrane protein